jgi:3-isopropylmalate/(R)-2-methylmalate dehydratase small subunit
MEEIVKHVLEDLNPDFPRQVKPGDIVVAGKHFGQSSGRAIAPKAMKATGIGCVVADTFSRTFYRNCFEVGLPAFELDGVTALVSEGDTIAIDLEHGLFSNVTTGVTRLGVPADPFLLDMLAAGGLIKMVAARPEWLGA